MTYMPNSPVKELQLHRPRLSAWLEIAGEPVPLLDPRLIRETNTVCTCVEALPEQEYVLAYRLEMDRPEEADVCVDVTVDGKALPGLWLPRGHGFWATPADSQDRIVRIGANGAKNGLSFAELAEDGARSGSAGKQPRNTKLGTIQLDVNYVHASTTPNSNSPSPAGQETSSSTHEASDEPSTSSAAQPKDSETEIEVTSARLVGFSFFYRSRATLLATGIIPSATAAAAAAPVNTHATPIKALPARFAALKTPWSAASSPLSQCDSVWGTPQLNGSAPGSPYTPATPMAEWEPVKAGGRGEASSPVRPGDERDVMIGGKRRAEGGDGEGEGFKRQKSEVPL